MGTIRIPIPSGQVVSQVLSQIPPETQAIFRRGYSVTCSLSDEKRHALVSRSIEALEEHSMSLANTDLQKELGLSEDDGEAALGAVTLLVSAVAAQENSKATEDVVADFAKARIIETEDVPKIQTLFNSLRSRASELGIRVQRSQLATRILPSYMHLRTTVDLRLESGDKRMAVVVGIIHIHTDDRDANINFQLTSPQLEKLVKRLQELQREMSDADKLIPVWEKKQG